jgi:DNA-binding transcriptional LysR family regulator
MQLDARLRAFAGVARQGSFSLAATELHVSQPAISKHVAALEAELGVCLVERRRSGAVLTATGRVLADYVLRAEALLASAAQAVAAAEDPAAGTVTVVASGIPGEYLVPKFLATFRARHPQTNVRLQVTTSGDALALVRAHEVELAVIGGFSAPSDIEFEVLVEDEIVLAAAPTFATRRLRRWDLERVTWLTREKGSSTRAAVEAARWQLGIHGAETLELPSWAAVKTAAVAGMGIAAISRFAIEHELDSGALAVLDVPRWRLRRTISVATARDVPLSPPARLFRDALRELVPRAAIAAQDGGSSRRDRSTLGRLAVFVDGFEADAAEYVCDIPAGDLERLCARGRLVREGRRFALADVAPPPRDDSARRRHADFFASLVEESEPHLTHLEEDEWASRLERERANIDAAARWAGSAGEHALQLRLLAQGWRLWLARGYPDEWRTILEELLDDVTEPQLRLLALTPVGWLAYGDEELERAEEIAEERLRLGRALGDDLSIAGGFTLLACVAEARGDLDAAQHLTKQAVDADRRAGDEVRLSHHLANLAQQLIVGGDLEGARAAAEEVAALARERGDHAIVANASFQLAQIALLEGRPTHALELVREYLTQPSLTPAEESWSALEVAGAACVGAGQHEVGVRLLAFAERYRDANGRERPRSFTSARDSALGIAQAALGSAAVARETRRGARLTHDRAVQLVCSA